ncbi:MAG: tetratricopeptide repeat protein [Candidatus Eisenbacteria bacterium]|uniref:Tetratricopeptide repeat protein n=1 Tax=Eiseniibacteriota bacterium TaxID=2212470 RepID=A0A933SFF6_UNCEI|nr:tetratricopeptide repeat protein [Candidatus Eisenbacteria bacterium]
MKRRVLTILAAALVCAATALAYLPPSPVQNLLYRAKDPADLRAQLAAHRDSIAATDSLDAAEAWYWIGVSHERSGERDAAIAAYRRAHAVRANAEDALALADLLMLRGTRADGAEAAKLLAPVLERFAADRTPRGADVRLRAAWATALAGDPAAACRAVLDRPGDLLTPKAPIPRQALWTARFAPLLLEHGHAAEGAARLTRALSSSRGRDTALVRLARGRGVKIATPAEFARRADSALAVSAAGAPLVATTVRAADGARITVWLLRTRPGAPLALLAVSPEAESFAGADSLVSQLYRAGVSVAIVDPRGSRSSASAATPHPHAWIAREDAFQQRLARDLSAAIGPASAAMRTDPARVCVIAEGPLAMAAALSARDDARVRTVVLAGATPSGAERGWLIAVLTASHAPVFFQQGPEDVYANEVVDRIASLLPSRQVRVADSQWTGRGFALFRAGAKSGERLTNWLADEWTSRPATPRARRR